MKTVKTGIWEVRVRVAHSMDLLTRKYFFSTTKKDEFVEQIRQNVKGINIFEDWRTCEDMLTYDE